MYHSVGRNDVEVLRSAKVELLVRPSVTKVGIPIILTTLGSSGVNKLYKGTGTIV